MALDKTMFELDLDNISVDDEWKDAIECMKSHGLEGLFKRLKEDLPLYAQFTYQSTNPFMDTPFESYVHGIISFSPQKEGELSKFCTSLALLKPILGEKYKFNEKLTVGDSKEKVGTYFEIPGMLKLEFFSSLEMSFKIPLAFNSSRIGINTPFFLHIHQVFL